MSFDLLPNENAATMLRAARNPSVQGDPGIWHNFLPGAVDTAMEGFAKTARAIDLLGAVGPMVTDALTGGTDRQDAYFQEHDEFFNRAVDYWTPKPGEVGTAGRVVGGLIPLLTEFAASPALAIGSAELGSAEDLSREGVPAGKAVAAGAVQGTGLALGAYIPMLGKTLLSRVGLGAASNVAQGVVTRAATAKVLEGEKAAAQFNPWDGESLVIDALMGTGFGALTHAAAPKEGPRLTETDKAAILGANQARHLEDTTAPGLPVNDVSRTAHATAMKKAIDDVLNDRPAEVGQILQDAQFSEDPARQRVQEGIRQALADEANAIAPPEAPIVPKETIAPVERPPVPEGEAATPIDPTVAEAQARLAEGPAKMVDENGNARDLGAELKTATEDVAQAKQDEGVFQTAVACFMGL